MALDLTTVLAHLAADIAEKRAVIQAKDEEIAKLRAQQEAVTDATGSQRAQE